MLQRDTDQNKQNKGDEYDFPGQQIIHISGNSSVEAISLPNLQQYYTNIMTFNRDYAYFSVNYLEFPLNDSIQKIIGNDVQIGIKFQMLYVLKAIDVPTIMESGANVGIIEFTIPITMESGYIKTTEELVQQINGQLQNTVTQATYWPIGSATQYTPNNDIRLVFSYFYDFYFDPATQKLAMQLQKPTINVDAAYTNPQSPGTPRIPVSLNVQITGQQTGKAAQLCAALFGGSTTAGYQTWFTEMRTGPTAWFFKQLVAASWVPYPIIADARNTANALFRNQQSLICYSRYPCRLFIDPYVYIRGAPQSSVWNKDGTNSDLLMIVARNKLPNQVTPATAYLAQEGHWTKTSLMSLRNMTLKFTDSDGDLLQLDDNYMFDMIINFKI